MANHVVRHDRQIAQQRGTSSKATSVFDWAQKLLSEQQAFHLRVATSCCRGITHNIGDFQGFARRLLAFRNSNFRNSGFDCELKGCLEDE